MYLTLRIDYLKQEMIIILFIEALLEGKHCIILFSSFLNLEQSDHDWRFSCTCWLCIVPGLHEFWRRKTDSFNIGT